MLNFQMFAFGETEKNGKIQIGEDFLRSISERLKTQLEQKNEKIYRIENSEETEEINERPHEIAENMKDFRILLENIQDEQASVKEYFEIQDSCLSYENYDPFDPEISEYFTINLKPLYVKNEYLRGGLHAYLDPITHKLSISEYERKKQECIELKYSKISFISDFETEFSDDMLLPRDQEVDILDTDFVRVTCYVNNPDKNKPDQIESYHHQVIHKRKSKYDVIDPKEISPHSFNIIMLGFDSLSRGNIVRSLPNFLETLDRIEKEKECPVVEFKKFNIVGDGTTDNLLGFLTSELEKDLPDTRRGRNGTVFVDTWPWIYKDLHEKGYATSYGETWSDMTAFQWRLNGFAEEPVDHYYRTFLYSVPDRIRYHFGMRDLVKWNYERVVDYTIDQMFQTYDKGNNKVDPRPIFSFCYIMDLHGRIVPAWQVGDYDLVLSNLLKKWYKLDEYDDNYDNNNNNDKDPIILSHTKKTYTNLFTQDTFGDSDFGENTILIFFGDHGQRYGLFRQSVFGRIEERNPPLTIVFPRSFLNSEKYKFRNEIFSKFLKIIRSNTDKLVTGYDVHATLRHLIDFDDTHLFSPQFEKMSYTDPRNRLISLFYSVPEQRTCEEAGIQHHFCICAEYVYINKRYYQQIDTYRIMYELGIQKIVDHLNEHIILRNQKEKCEKIYLGDILEVYFQLPRKEDLQRFHAEGVYNITGLVRRTYRVVFMFTNEERTYSGKLEGMFHIDHDPVSLQSLKDDQHAYLRNRQDKTGFSFVGEKTVSRIDSYGSLSCNPIPELRKYCSCVY